MHHFGQCTTVLLYTKHICGEQNDTSIEVYRWTLNTSMIVCICTLTQMHKFTQEENSCALQWGRLIGGRSLPKLNKIRRSQDHSPSWTITRSALSTQAAWPLGSFLAYSYSSPKLHLWCWSSGRFTGDHQSGSNWIPWKPLSRCSQYLLLNVHLRGKGWHSSKMCILIVW